jgi:hypothetical protein
MAPIAEPHPDTKSAAPPPSDTITNKQIAIMVFWVTVVAFIILCIFGITNRVVIFSSMSDLLLTWLVFLYPFVALVFVWSLIPDNETSRWNFTTKVAGIIAIIGFGILVIRVFYSSVKENGIVIGTMVAIFKLASSAIFGVFAFLGLLAYWAKERNASTLMYTLFGAFSGWALYKFINKAAVVECRAEKGSALNLRGPAVELLE